jgi:hypothetical protein
MARYHISQTFTIAPGRYVVRGEERNIPGGTYTVTGIVYLTQREMDKYGLTDNRALEFSGSYPQQWIAADEFDKIPKTETI